MHLGNGKPPLARAEAPFSLSGFLADRGNQLGQARNQAITLALQTRPARQHPLECRRNFDHAFTVCMTSNFTQGNSYS
jgi:hypothetical protein